MIRSNWTQVALIALAALVAGCGGGGGGSAGGGGPVVVSVTPASTVALTNSDTTDFSSSVTGNANEDVTWTVQGGVGNGSIDSNGVYTAPGTSGTFTIVATSQADPTKFDTASVIVGEATFRGIGDIAGGIDASSVTGLDEDGSVAVGSSVTGSGSQPARWTLSGGLTALDASSIGSSTDISFDGLTIVGLRNTGGLRAFTWNGGTFTDLPFVTGGSGPSAAFGVSGDASTVVGNGVDSGSDIIAVAWVGATAINLGFIAGGPDTSDALAADADGSIVVGRSSMPGGIHAVYWTRTGPSTYGAATALPFLAGGSPGGQANGVDDDGTVIVGEATTTNISSHTAAFRWTSGGSVELGDLAGGGLESRAFGVSGDGTIVVGESETDDAPVEVLEAFVWTQADGMQNLKTLLISKGMAGPLTGWTLTSAKAISRDGNVIAGKGKNPAGEDEGWIVELP